MQVGASRPAGRSHVPNYFTLFDPATGSDMFCKTSHMCIGGVVSGVMLYTDIPPIAALPSGFSYHTGTRCDNRSAHRCGKVNTFMHGIKPADRVSSCAKAR